MISNVHITQDINLQRLEELQIHLWGKIQPHGVLFVIDEFDLRIVQTSNNTKQFLGITPEEIVNLSLDDVFDSFQIEQLKTGLESNNLDFINPTKLWARVDGDNYVIFDGVFHRNSEGFLILELEPYLGLHYPASDIPLPARRLFTSNYIRLIPDAKASGVDLFPKLHPLNNEASQKVWGDSPKVRGQ
ncbi:hypothetical protein P9B04_07770, partial [Crocosphaera sp. Alani8]